MYKIILYSTQGCHLCEQAKALYQSLALSEQLYEVDIAFDDQLFASYGVTIPVIAMQKQGMAGENQVLNELSWPFSADELKNWLNKVKI